MGDIPPALSMAHPETLLAIEARIGGLARAGIVRRTDEYLVLAGA